MTPPDDQSLAPANRSVGDPAPPEPASSGRCAGCGGRPRWESLVDGGEERWLSVCRCGRMQAFLPDRPGHHDDPLRAYLHGPGRPLNPESPPWVRLFLASLEQPNPPRWRHTPPPCSACQAAAVFALQACPRPAVIAACTLCLACGHTTATYTHLAAGHTEHPARGGAWTPPCPAVQRLRDCVHRPAALLRNDGWSREHQPRGTT